MSDDAERVRRLLCQQAAIAGFGSFALREGDLETVLTEAARVCADGLGVRFSKVCRYRPAENDLLIVAGYGWHAGVIGCVVSRADSSSPQGRAFITGEPSICNDLRRDDHFKLPAFYGEHGIISTVDVLIKGSGDQPFGVLEIDNDEQHDYDRHDVDFLTAFANVLAEAVGTLARREALQMTIDRMRALVIEKDRLLDQKNVLAEELQHRVRNNLQLIYGMLHKQVEDTVDPEGKRGIRAIARRVSTIAQVYDHLLGSEMMRTTDFGSYVRSLCLTLAELQASPDDIVTLTSDSEPLILDLDTVTILGIVLTELVSNSYDHAFSGGSGSIRVSVRLPAGDDQAATLTIVDDGSGFTPQAESKRHGLGLVRRLIEQIGGTVMLDADHGTVWTIRFPLGAPLVTFGDPAKAAMPDGCGGVTDRDR